MKRIEKIETAVEPMFQDHFVNAMAIPHKIAPYTKLQEIISFPDPRKSTLSDGFKRAKRRGRPR